MGGFVWVALSRLPPTFSRGAEEDEVEGEEMLKVAIFVAKKIFFLIPNLRPLKTYAHFVVTPAQTDTSKSNMQFDTPELVRQPGSQTGNKKEATSELHFVPK